MTCWPLATREKSSVRGFGCPDEVREGSSLLKLCENTGVEVEEVLTPTRSGAEHYCTLLREGTAVECERR